MIAMKEHSAVQTLGSVCRMSSDVTGKMTAIHLRIGMREIARESPVLATSSNAVQTKFVSSTVTFVMGRTTATMGRMRRIAANKRATAGL